MVNLRRMLKKKVGIILGRLAHHYKRCIDAMEQSVWAELGCATSVVGNVPGETLIGHLKFLGKLSQRQRASSRVEQAIIMNTRTAMRRTILTTSNGPVCILLECYCIVAGFYATP